MQEILTSISEKILLVSFIGLVMVLFANRKRTAFEAVLFISCLISCLQILIEIKVMNMASSEYQKEYWYFGFALTDFAHAFICMYACKKLSLLLDKASIFMMCGFSVAGAVQLARYADRVILETNVLGGFYSSAIPTINVMMMIAIVTHVFLVFWGLSALGQSRRSL